MGCRNLPKAGSGAVWAHPPSKWLMMMIGLLVSGLFRFSTLILWDRKWVVESTVSHLLCECCSVLYRTAFHLAAEMNVTFCHLCEVSFIYSQSRQKALGFWRGLTCLHYLFPYSEHLPLFSVFALFPHSPSLITFMCSLTKWDSCILWMLLMPWCHFPCIFQMMNLIHFKSL